MYKKHTQRASDVVAQTNGSSELRVAGGPHLTTFVLFGRKVWLVVAVIQSPTSPHPQPKTVAQNARPRLSATL